MERLSAVSVPIVPAMYIKNCIVGRSGGFAPPPPLTTWGDRSPSLVAVVYYHATYLFSYSFFYVVICQSMILR